MALQIPGSDRIINYWDYIGEEPPEGFDPNDPTIINADWIMKMMDKIVNGNYTTKSFNVVQSVAELPINAEQGQTAYVIGTDYKDSFFIYNGLTWFNPIKTLFDTKQDNLPTLQNGKILSNDGTNFIWEDRSSIIDWGMINGKVYNQTDLWDILLKGLSNNTPLADLIGGYPKGSILRFYDGKVSYLISSLVDNNMEEPTRENIQYRESDTNKKWRCIERVVVKADKNENGWYRLYSDGWCEQGGTVDTGSTARSITATITFQKEFEDNLYSFSFIPIRGGDDATNIVGAIGTKSKTATSIFVQFYGRSEDDLARRFCWEAKGYVKNASITTIINVSSIANPSSSSTIVEQIGSDIVVNAGETFDIEIAGAGLNGNIDSYFTSTGGIIRCVHTFTDATTLRLKKIRGRYGKAQVAVAIFSYDGSIETPILVAGSSGIVGRYSFSNAYGGSGYEGATGIGGSSIYKGYSYDGSEGNVSTENTPDGSGDWAGSGGRIAYGGTGYVASFLEDDTTAITGSETQGNTTYAYAKIYKIEE